MKKQNKTINIIKFYSKRLRNNNLSNIEMEHLLQFNIQIMRFEKLQNFKKQNIPHNLQYVK